VCEIEAKHKVVAHFFGTGAGLRLMPLDSDMAEMVMLRLLSQGIMFLAVHDSFLVQARSEGQLQEAMAAALQKTAKK
jgi:hypothetical protein